MLCDMDLERQAILDKIKCLREWGIGHGLPLERLFTRVMEAELDAITQHNFFTKRQMTIEGKLLFDADKLDAFAPESYRKIIAAIKNKKISKLQTLLYVNAQKHG